MSRAGRHAVCVCLVFLLAGLFPAPAEAVPPGRERGLIFGAGLGLNGCTGGRCNNLYPMLFTRIDVLFRIKKYVAPGLHTNFLFLAPSFPTGGDRAELWDVVFGPEIRGLLPWKRVDFWTAFMFGYYRSVRMVTGGGHTQRSVADGVGIGWGIGAEYFVLRDRLSVGGDFWLYKGFILEVCSRSGTNRPICNRRDVSGGSGLTFAVGATVNYFIPL